MGAAIGAAPGEEVLLLAVILDLVCELAQQSAAEMRGILPQPVSKIIQQLRLLRGQ